MFRARNYLIYVYDGGQAKVEGGKSLGTVPSLLIQGCDKISSTDGLLEGSLFNIFITRSFANSEILTVSGN